MDYGLKWKKIYYLKVKENIGEYVYIGNFIDILLKFWFMKRCIDKLYFIDIVILCYVKENVKK